MPGNRGVSRPGRRAPLRRTSLALVACLCSSIALSVPVASGITYTPAAHWSLDEGGGSSASDIIGSADGSLAGDAGWTAVGAAGSASALDLTAGGHIEIADGSVLRPNDLTLTAWVRSDAPPQDGTVIFEKGAFGCAGPSYGLYANDDGISLRFKETFSGTHVTRSLAMATAKVDLWDGQWHLVGMTVSNWGDGKLAIDGWDVSAAGTVVQPQPQPIVYEGATDQAARIGAGVDDACGRPAFTGQIDDVRLYHQRQALTSTFDLIPLTPTSIQTSVGDVFKPGDVMDVVTSMEPAEPRMGAIGHWLENEDTGERFSAGSLPIPAPQVGRWRLEAHFSGRTYESSVATDTFVVEPHAATGILTSSPSSLAPLQKVTLMAVFTSPFYRPAGKVQFVRTVSGQETSLGTVDLTALDPVTSRAILTVAGGLPPGNHPVIVKFAGDRYHAPAVAQVTVPVAPWPTTLAVDTPGVVTDNDPIVLEASVYASEIARADRAGVLVFLRRGSTTPACSVALESDGRASCRVSALPAGQHWFDVQYTGGRAFAAATASTSVTVVEDYVDATGVGRDHSTFYPKVDGYRDVLRVRGTRNEALSVLIEIRDPSGDLVVRKTVSSATGGYEHVWSGRTAGGSLLPAGKYSIAQTLTDRYGTTRTWASAVNLSHKRLVEKVSYVTRDGHQVAVRGDDGDGSITLSSTGGWARLAGDHPGGWVGVGYEFVLPAAEIYRSLRFLISTRYTELPQMMLTPPNEIGMQRFDDDGVCAYRTTWLPECFEHWDDIAWSTSTHWEDTERGGTDNIHDRRVRGLVSVFDGRLYIYAARVRVAYAVLE